MGKQNFDTSFGRILKLRGIERRISITVQSEVKRYFAFVVLQRQITASVNEQLQSPAVSFVYHSGMQRDESLDIASVNIYTMNAINSSVIDKVNIAVSCKAAWRSLREHPLRLAPRFRSRSRTSS